MIEFSELIDILPDPQVRRMEDMGAIAMDMDAVLFFTIDIAADLVPPFQDQALPAGLMHLVGKDTAKEAAADDDVIVHSLFLISLLIACGNPLSVNRSSQAAGRFVGAVLEGGPLVPYS